MSPAQPVSRPKSSQPIKRVSCAWSIWTARAQVRLNAWLAENAMFLHATMRQLYGSVFGCFVGCFCVADVCASCLRGELKCMEALEEKKLSHRDIAPRHWIALSQPSSGRDSKCAAVRLLDFGFCVPVGEEVLFQGLSKSRTHAAVAAMTKLINPVCVCSQARVTTPRTAFSTR